MYRDLRKYDLSHASLCKLTTADHFLEQFCLLDRDIREITHRDHDALKTRKVSTIQEYFRTLRAVLDEAVKDSLIMQSPYDLMRKLRKSDDEEEPAKRVDPFSRDELSRLLDVVDIE